MIAMLSSHKVSGRNPSYDVFSRFVVKQQKRAPTTSSNLTTEGSVIDLDAIELGLSATSFLDPVAG